MEGDGVKRRTLDFMSGVSTILSYIDGDPKIYDDSRTYSITGSQITHSHSHPELFYYRKAAKTAARLYRRSGDRWMLNSWDILKNQDVGGNFYTTRRNSWIVSPKVNVTRVRKSNQEFTLRTQFFVMDMNVDDLDTKWPSRPNELSEYEALLAQGSTAISRTAPTVPMESLATFFGELRNDGLPSLISSLALRAKNLKQLLNAAGGEYLNVVFGWKPFVSDLKGLCSTVVEARKQLLLYEERAGRNIGRSYEFPATRSTTSSVVASLPSPSLNSRLYPNGVPTTSVTRVVEDYRHYWFEGVYSYHLPTPDTAREKILLYASEADKLLGVRITPDVLWNLAPWTWLSDWFFNVGSIMTNISAFTKDGLMLRRGYIMCESHTTNTYSHPGFPVLGWGHTGPLTQAFETRTKSRAKASPWGFGVTFTAFTPKQIAIMAALGLTRS